jgi:hypothetical protein
MKTALMIFFITSNLVSVKSVRILLGPAWLFNYQKNGLTPSLSLGGIFPAFRAEKIKTSRLASGRLNLRYLRVTCVGNYLPRIVNVAIYSLHNNKLRLNSPP